MPFNLSEATVRADEINVYLTAKRSLHFQPHEQIVQLLIDDTANGGRGYTSNQHNYETNYCASDSLIRARNFAFIAKGSCAHKPTDNNTQNTHDDTKTFEQVRNTLNNTRKLSFKIAHLFVTLSFVPQCVEETISSLRKTYPASVQTIHT
jgi:hypothetical protein